MSKKRQEYKKYRTSYRKINLSKFKDEFSENEGLKFSHVKGKAKRNNFCIWCLIFVLFLFALLFFNYVLMPRIVLKGNRFITLNYKEKYRESGFKAFYQGEDISEYVKVKGCVNSNKLGIYKIIYEVKYGSLSRSVVRKVEVKDKSAPVIRFANKGDISVCPGRKYKNPKYEAFDNYDGNITDKVKVIKRNNYILYKVSDRFGNSKVLRKNIKYEDRERPVISLEGGDTVYSYIGEEYKDSGYKAIDNCDGDITNQVKVSGKVDDRVAGEYKLVYKVIDKAGNTSKKTRKVIVSERSKNGVIYLTFDDGPKSGTTDVILDILKEEGVRATFFVTNSGPDELIKREYDEGHTVALHTASHNYSYVYSSIDNYFNDLYSVQDRVKRITGYESKIIRFPGGSSNTVSRRYSPGIMSTLTQEVINRGFRYYDWNILSGDAEFGEHTADEIYNNVISKLSLDRVNVVLMHDIKPYTRDALREIILYGKNNGYRFANIIDSTEMLCQKVNN